MYYNTRLQPCRISVESSGSTPTSCTDAADIGNILDYTYNFSLGTSDNGNVMGITNNVDATRSQAGGRPFPTGRVANPSARHRSEPKHD
jgi:hypothetical protein